MTEETSHAERVLEKLEIEVARRKGGRLWAICPFHKDRHADNFFVRYRGRRRGQWHCFTCKAGGGALWRLVAKARKCTDEKAKDWLKDIKADAPPPAASGVRLEVRVARDRPFRLPPEVILEPWDEWVSGMREYALERGITPEQVERWGIGYAVDAKLAGRIVFPIRDAAGRVCGYSARSFTNAARSKLRKHKRYLMPTEGEGADLDVMWGEEHWPDGPGEVLVVVEGVINGLAVERALEAARIVGHVGVMNGSHVRPMHVLKALRFSLVLVLSDPDEAGDGAAVAWEASLARHRCAERVRLPAGEDAQSMPMRTLARKLWRRVEAFNRSMTSPGSSGRTPTRPASSSWPRSGGSGAGW